MDMKKEDLTNNNLYVINQIFDYETWKTQKKKQAQQIKINNNCNEESREKQESSFNSLFNSQTPRRNNRQTYYPRNIKNSFQQKYKDEKTKNLELSQKIKSMDQTIKSMDQTIKLRNQTIKGRDQILKGKDNTIKIRDQTIKIRDQMINSLKSNQLQMNSKINQFQIEIKKIIQKIKQKQIKITSFQEIVKKSQKQSAQKTIKLENILKQLYNVNQTKNKMEKQLNDGNQALKENVKIYEEKLRKIQQNLLRKEKQNEEMSKMLNKEKREQETQVEYLIQLFYAFQKSDNMFQMQQCLKHAAEIQPQKHSVSDIRLLYRYKRDSAVLFNKMTVNKKNLFVIAKTVHGQFVGGFTSCGFGQNSKFNNDGYGFLFSTDKLKNLNFFDLKSPQKLPSQNLKDQIRFGYRELIINGNFLQSDFGNLRHQSRGHYANSRKLKRNQFIISPNQQFQVIQLEDYEIYQFIFENQIISKVKDHQEMVEKVKNLQNQLKELKEKDLKSQQILKEKKDQLMNSINLDVEKQKLVCEKLKQKYQLLTQQCKRKENLIEQQKKQFDLKAQQKSNQIQELKKSHKEKIEEMKVKMTNCIKQMI